MAYRKGDRATTIAGYSTVKPTDVTIVSVRTGASIGGQPAILVKDEAGHHWCVTASCLTPRKKTNNHTRKH